MKCGISTPPAVLRWLDTENGGFNEIWQEAVRSRARHAAVRNNRGARTQNARGGISCVNYRAPAIYPQAKSLPIQKIRSNVGSMLEQRRRRWPSIERSFDWCRVGCVARPAMSLNCRNIHCLGVLPLICDDLFQEREKKPTPRVKLAHQAEK